MGKEGTRAKIAFLVVVASARAGACGGHALPRASSGQETAAPEIPPFPDLCSRYQIEYAGGGCGQGCPSVPVDCGSYGSPYVPCAPRLGCVGSFDAAAVCESEQAVWSPSLADCVGYCISDDECGPGRCVVLPGAKAGNCIFVDGFCVDDGDCPRGHCVATRADGVRSCSDSGDGDACNRTADCADGLHCILPPSSFLGACGAGDLAGICYRTSDCAAPMRCVTAEPVPSLPGNPGQCTDGGERSPCGADADCRAGRCIQLRCNTGQVNEDCGSGADCKSGLWCVQGYCRDGSLNSTCEQDSQCAPGLYCAIGELCSDGAENALCDRDDQCRSGRCALNADYPICTSGDPGAPCMDAGDCASGACVRAPGISDRDLGACS
jgi:hypothetical protein